MEELINLADFESAARERLPQASWDYYRSGAEDEITLGANREAFRRWALQYRVLVDVEHRDLGVEVLGRQLDLPVLVAPTAFHRLAHAEGELATAAAARDAGIPMVLSTLSTTPMEEVAATGVGLWFQLYVYRDRGVTRALVERAAAAGCQALVLTVDAPLIGRREADIRNRFALPPGLQVANLLPAGFESLGRVDDDSGLAAYVSRLLDPSLSWDDLGWLRSISPLPLFVKGVVRGDDARQAAAHGAEGVIVSNHGGRQLDGSVATLDVLPEIAEAVDLERDRGFLVLLDGGVRRGTDVFKALALGARAVLVGRPALWGLAVGGQAGVARVLDILKSELHLAMALAGCPTLADIDRSLLRPSR